MSKPKNPHAVALGKLGGSKGGKIRAAKLTPKQRSDIARKAVLARWERVKKSKEIQSCPFFLELGCKTTKKPQTIANN
jgi:hypothetical protein